MKLPGYEFKGPNVEYIVIPRGDGKDIVFKAQAILDMTPLESLLKRPVPGKRMLPGGVVQADTDDPIFKTSISEYGNLRYAWIVIQSLKATEGLEWETVKDDDPGTWLNWEKELKEAGFTQSECEYIQLAVANANAMNQTKLDEARTHFLLSLRAGHSQP